MRTMVGSDVYHESLGDAPSSSRATAARTSI